MALRPSLLSHENLRAGHVQNESFTGFRNMDSYLDLQDTAVDGDPPSSARFRNTIGNTHQDPLNYQDKDFREKLGRVKTHFEDYLQRHGIDHVSVAQTVQFSCGIQTSLNP